MFRKKPTVTAVGRIRPVHTSPAQRTAPVFSYYAKRSARPGTVGRGEAPPVTAADVQRRNSRHKWFRRTPVIIGGLVLLVVAIFNLPVQDTPQIVTTKGAAGAIFLHPTTVYAKAAHEQLNSSFRNGNKLTIDTGRIEKDLRQQFPELAAVNVSVPLLGTRPRIYLEPATPALLLTALDGDTFVVDQDGRALASAGETPGMSRLGLPVVKDNSGLPLRGGQTVLPASSVAFITEVVGQLKAKQLTLEELVLPAASSELDAKVQGTPYHIKFNLQGNAREEAGTYLAVKQQLERDHKTPNEYIDVRVTDRAYYR